MTLGRLALRNMLRSKRRTVLSTAAIVVGVMYLILGQAFVGGIEEGIVQAAEDGMTGHITVRVDDYPTTGLSHPVDDLLTLSPEARALLDDDARVAAWVERTVFVMTLSTGDDSLRIRGVGVGPRDAEVFQRTTWKVEGEVPAAAADGVLLGVGVARMLEIEVGDRIVLRTRTHAGAINALDVAVAGRVSTGNMALDGTTVYLPDALARDLVRNDRPTHIGVRLERRGAAPAFAEELRAAVGAGAEVLTVQEDTAELLRMQQLRRNALNVLVGVLLAMSALAIANTILMAAHERVREVGTLRAMGMTRRRVVALFVTEGAIMGCLAGLLGLAVGGLGAWYFSENPIDLGALMQGVDYGNIQFSAYLYTAFEPGALVLPVAIAVGTAVVASIYPAFLASKLEIADAVRAS